MKRSKYGVSLAMVADFKVPRINQLVRATAAILGPASELSYRSSSVKCAVECIKLDIKIERDYSVVINAVIKAYSIAAISVQRIYIYTFHYNSPEVTPSDYW